MRTPVSRGGRAMIYSMVRSPLPVALVGAWCKACPADCKVDQRFARSKDEDDTERGVTELLSLKDSPPLVGWGISGGGLAD